MTVATKTRKLEKPAIGANPCRGRNAAQRFTIEEAQRFRAAVDVSPDLVLLIDPVSMRYLDVNETACHALGYSREELLSMGPQDIFSVPREELAATYASLIASAGQSGVAEGAYRCKDGSSLVVEAFRHAVPTAEGHVIVALARDIGGRKRAEQLLALEHGMTRALAEADSVSAALKTAIRAICESEGWECGRYFGADESSGVLRLVEAWSIPGAAVERFIEESRGLTYAPGVGLVGQAWQTGEPLWAEDIAKDSRARKGLAREAGLHGAFMFPVLAGGKTLGVLVFHSRKVRKPDARLLQAIRVVGTQVGQFLKRKQAEEVMRESEERFRSLTELSSDWYWEQDENFRFIGMQNATPGSGGRGPMSGVGQTRWDVPALNMTEADWAAHRAVLEAHQPFRDLELHRTTAEGKSRYTSVSGEPIFDRAGRFTGYRGVGKDITARKRTEQLRALEHTVNRRIAESDSASAGLKAAIRAVCEAEGWECGRYFALDEQAGLLRFADAWSAGDAAVEKFIAASRERVYRPGEGFSGLAWQSGQALWSPDVTKDPRSSSGASAAGPTRAMGMHATFVFPLVADGRTIGVLSFASRKAREPEPQLLEVIHAIGRQIGQFLKRKQAEEVLRESEERFRSLTMLSSDLYWEQDEELRFTKFSGMGSQRVNQGNLPYIGKKRWEQNYVNMSAEDWAAHIELLRAQQPFKDLELCRLDEAGRKIWVSVSGEPVCDASGRFKGYRGVGKDITERKNTEERIQYLANHDALTGLPNRAMFSEVLDHAIQNARRYGRSFAVLFVDLDRFKVINDTLGHEAGDNLLKEMTQRLSATVRSSDFVARLGGDEFVVMVQEVSEVKQVEVVSRKILAAFARPLAIQGQEYRVTASIGICMYPGDAQDEQALMKNADIAMYRAKEEGKNTYKFYSAEANIHSFERLALETALRRGLERSEFFLHYQAKLDLASGEISGVEALVRWQHPDLGIVPPGQFIPLAEETGLIVPLGKWVLRTACAQNVAWQREGLPPLRMSVNISARQFADEELLTDIAAALEESGMHAQLLELELTESMVMQHPERATAILNALKSTGVRLAIDDFGVGYSSLTHLKRFPIDTLKVDRSFIRDLPQNAEDKAITEAIIAMGKSLELTIVAEGVETLEQQTFLQEHDCDEMQGFYFSKPIPSEQFALLLRKRMARDK